MKRTATIILNRNLPEVTDNLYGHLQQYDSDYTDVYVVEAGSDIHKLSRHYTWHVNSPEARLNGLRYCRGMNYGLYQLWKEGKFDCYDSFLLLANDTELEPVETVKPLLDILDEHSRVGILSPCSPRWGERHLLKSETTKYFWFIHNNAYLLRREFILDIINAHETDPFDFLFDAANFRGYGAEQELIAKAYNNDWAAAITSLVWASENESYLLNKADLIKTEPYEENLRLYVQEGLAWMKKKYGFNSHWAMQQYVKYSYEKFFEFYPEYSPYKL